VLQQNGGNGCCTVFKRSSNKIHIPIYSQYNTKKYNYNIEKNVFKTNQYIT
jgi:hypothetical protein